MSRAQEALDQAAQWIVRQEEIDWSDQDQAEFDAWFHAAEGHKAAYWRLKHSWNKADRIKALGPSASPSLGRRFVFPWTSMVAAACMVMVIGATSYHWPQLASYIFSEPQVATVMERVETSVGGRKRVELSDGTRIELNTASALRIVMSGKTRKVFLERGEAYFEVAHVRNQPFVIESGDHVVTVLGTKFAVRQDATKTIVSVVSGRVQLAGSGSATGNRLAILTRGDVAVASGNSTLVTTHSPEELEGILSWRGGMLTFDGTPLRVAVAEFNRYNRRQIVLSDSKAAGMRIGGSFPSTNPEAFIRLMQDGYGLKVQIEGDKAKVSR